MRFKQIYRAKKKKKKQVNPISNKKKNNLICQRFYFVANYSLQLVVYTDGRFK